MTNPSFTADKIEQVIWALKHAERDVRDCSRDCPVYRHCGAGSIAFRECVLLTAADMIEPLLTIEDSIT